MLRWLVLLACACAAPRAPVPPPSASLPALELVATIPIETELRSPLPEAHTVWLAMITSAQHSLDFAEFYASNEPNSRLEPVVAAIEAAIKRGVRVRFLADHGFMTVYPDTLERLRRAGADVRASVPADVTLHAKYFIVDDREAFFGSQNFDWRAIEHNLELGMHARDAGIVAGLAAMFAADWAATGASAIGAPATGASAIGAPASDAPAPAPASALASPPKTVRVSPAFVASPKDELPPAVAWDLPKLVALIDGARSRIRVQLLTYKAGEWQELEAPLLAAAKRGVAVELMLADWSKRKGTLPGLQQLARTPGIAIKLVTIPEAKRGFIPFARVIHAKAMVVDGAHAWVGTGNWERDYFYADRNVGVLADDPQIVRGVDQFFTMVWTSRYAERLDPDATYEPPRIE